MSRAFTPPIEPDLELAVPILAAARRWRHARDRGLPAIIVLYTELERVYQGVLAPAFDGLFSIFEAGLGRRFDASTTLDACPTRDELTLLELFDDDRASPTYLISSMVEPFQVAARSTKIMIAAQPA